MSGAERCEQCGGPFGKVGSVATCHACEPHGCVIGLCVCGTCAKREEAAFNEAKRRAAEAAS